MRRVLHLALHDTRLFVLARESLFFMFGMPVLFMLFFSSVFGNRQPNDIRVGLPVVNEDAGWLGAALVQQLAGERFDVKSMTAAAADSAKPPRVVRIPADFTARILAGQRVTLRLEKAPRSNAEFDLAADVRLRRAQAAFLGNLIRWEGGRRAPAAAAEQPKTGAGVGADAAAGSGVAPGRGTSGSPAPAAPIAPEISAAEQARLLALIAEPPRITVASRFAGQGRAVPTGAGQSIPGMLAMFVVMITMIGGAESLTREKHAGTLARLATTPLSRGEILAGKLLHLTLVAIVQALVLMLAGEALGRLHVFGISFTWGRHWPAIVALVMAYGLAVGCMTLFVSGLFRTTQQAESLGWLAGMIMAAFGGCWWPIEIMPPAVRAVAHAFPTFWAMKGLHALITFGRSPLAIVQPVSVLLVFGLIFALLGRRTMRVA